MQVAYFSRFGRKLWMMPLLLLTATLRSLERDEIYQDLQTK